MQMFRAALIAAMAIVLSTVAAAICPGSADWESASRTPLIQPAPSGTYVYKATQPTPSFVLYCSVGSHCSQGGMNVLVTVLPRDASISPKNTTIVWTFTTGNFPPVTLMVGDSLILSWTSGFHDVVSLTRPSSPPPKSSPPSPPPQKANIEKVTGSCSCASLPLAEQQACLNRLVVTLQNGLRTAKLLTTELCSATDQNCINDYVIASAKKTKTKECPSSVNLFQACINQIICSQYRFAHEGFTYVGPAKLTDAFKPNESFVKVNKSGQFLDPAQNIDIPEQFNIAFRVAGGDQFAAYAVNQVCKTCPPTDPGGLDQVKINPGPEAKFPQQENKGRKLNYLFAPDDRTRVNPTTSYPWSAAVMIEFKVGESGFSCSGALIAKDAVLTAGHCVSSAGVWANSIKITPGRNGNTKPFGTIGVVHMTTYSGWFNSGNFKYDMAVIRLDRSIGSTVGWLGMIVSDSFTSNLNAIGYPGDKTYATQWYSYCSMVTDADPSNSVTKNTCDIYPGQSGSGNYIITDGKRYIRGITSYHTCTCLSSACTGSGCGAPYANYFQQLTSQRFTDAKSWAGI